MKPKVTVITGKEATIHRLKSSYDHVYGTYDTKTGDIGIIGDQNEDMIDKTIEVINHEYLHAILHEEINEHATIALDNIDNKENSLYREFS